MSDDNTTAEQTPAEPPVEETKPAEAVAVETDGGSEDYVETITVDEEHSSSST